MTRQKVTGRRITVNLRAPEVPIVDRMQDEGYEISEVVRGLIRDWGKINYPQEKGYSQSAKIRAEILKAKNEAEMTISSMSNEEYAEQILRGKVRDGSKVAFRVANGQEMYIPLSEIKQYTTDSNALIKVHNSLLDKTFNFPGGKAPSEAQYAQIWKGWD